MDFDGLGLCFSFDRWCCLQVEFYSQNGTSIMELVVLGKVWALLQESSLVLSLGSLLWWQKDNDLSEDTGPALVTRKS